MAALERIAALLATALAACAATGPAPAPRSAPPPHPPPASAENVSAEVEMADTPFTAEQIRAATKAGRTYRFEVEAPGKPARVRELTFVTVDAEGAEVRATSGDAEPSSQRVSWESLRQHAAFPKARVTTHDEEITVPAGTFACVVYVVRDGDKTSTFYFAKSLPGAPVLFFSEVGGVRTETSTLVEHRAE